MEKIAERRGGSTLEYVIVLGAAILLATILFNVLMVDGKSSIQSTVARIFSLEKLSFSSSSSEQVPGNMGEELLETESKGGIKSTLSNLFARDQELPNFQKPIYHSDQGLQFMDLGQKNDQELKEIKEKCMKHTQYFLAFESCVKMHLEGGSLEEKAQEICGERHEAGSVFYKQCIYKYTGKEKQERLDPGREDPDVTAYLLDMLLDAMPIVGNYKSATEAVTGKNEITGEELDGFSRGMAAAGIALPMVKHIDKVGILNKIARSLFSGGGKGAAKGKRSPKAGESSSSAGGGKGDKGGGDSKKGKGDKDAEEIGWSLPPKGGGKINGRYYTQHALERMAPDTPQVRAELEKRAHEWAIRKEVKNIEKKLRSMFNHVGSLHL